MQLISVELLMSEQQKNDVNLNEETVLEGNASNTDASIVMQVVPPGAQLAEIRKAKGITIEQVASHLKLAQRQVNAIEADDYAALPGAAITRGFIRAYAKYLGVDATALLDALPKQEMRLGSVAGSERVQSATYQESTLPLRDRKGNGSLFAGLAVLVVIVAAGAFYYFNHNETDLSLLQSSSAPSDQQVDDVNAANIGEAVVEAPVAAADTPAVDVASVNVEQAKFERIPVAGATTVSAPAANVTNVIQSPALANNAQAVAPAQAASVPTPPLAQTLVEKVKPAVNESGRDALRLVTREDSWVELRRVDGAIVYSKLIPAGSTEVIDVAEPLQLVIGNAHGVQAILRGTPLDLPLSKNNVARLNVK
jgi:cytoskeleton protein RodZ